MKTKNIFLTAALIAASFATFAQVGIGTTSPAYSAALDITSSDKALLVPRVASTNAIATPVNGMIIYDLSSNCFKGYQNGAWSDCGFARISITSGGTAEVASYTCDTASAGAMTLGTSVSGVTQTITATVTTVGTYNISTTTDNGVTFSGLGIFAGTGPQNIVLTATGTPTAAGSNSFTLNTTPNCSFNRTAGFGTSSVFVASGVKKEFLSHNLGADTSLDPHVPVVGLQGAYIQWGRRGPNTTGDSRLDWQTAANTPNFAAAPTSVNANADPISGWISTGAANYAWRSAEGAKNTVDPCPAGYRVPTSAEWTGVNTYNTASRTGTFVNGNTAYGSALHYGPDASTKLLTLPAAGYHYSFTGELFGRGSGGNYWSSTEDGPGAFRLFFSSSTVNPANYSERASGYSLRCIAE